VRAERRRQQAWPPAVLPPRAQPVAAEDKSGVVRGAPAGASEPRRHAEPHPTLARRPPRRAVRVASSSGCACRRRACRLTERAEAQSCNMARACGARRAQAAHNFGRGSPRARSAHSRSAWSLPLPLPEPILLRPDSILRTVSTLTLSAPLHGPSQRAILLAHWINPARGACRRRTWSGRPPARSARRRRRARRAARARRSSRGSGGRRSRRMRPTTTTTWPTTARRRAPPRARTQPEGLKGC